MPLQRASLLGCSISFAALCEYPSLLHPRKDKQCCFRKDKRRVIRIHEINKRWHAQLINDLKAPVTCLHSLWSLLCTGETVPQLLHSIVLAGWNEGGGEPDKYEKKNEGRGRSEVEHRMKATRGESAGSAAELFIILSPCDCDLWAPLSKARETRGEGQSGTCRGRNRWSDTAREAAS